MCSKRVSMAVLLTMNQEADRTILINPFFLFPRGERNINFRFLCGGAKRGKKGFCLGGGLRKKKDGSNFHGLCLELTLEGQVAKEVSVK